MCICFKTVAKIILGFPSRRRPLSFHTPSSPLQLLADDGPQKIYAYTWQVCFPPKCVNGGEQFIHFINISL